MEGGDLEGTLLGRTYYMVRGHYSLIPRPPPIKILTCSCGENFSGNEANGGWKMGNAVVIGGVAMLVFTYLHLGRI